MSLHRAAIALSIVPLLAPLGAAAADCPGPAECCADKPADTLDHPVVVSLGVVVVGLYNVAEKTGTWDADYYLYESWPPQKGFAPQTEIVNEVARLSE